MQASHGLVRIVGVVSDLNTSAASEDFVFRSGDRAAGGAAAMGLAASGLAGAATGAAMSSGDAADKVTAFICRVGAHKVSGRFGEVTFSNSDHVEVIGTQFDGEFAALAVARPFDRTIWMHPHCSRGTKAYRQYCLRWIPTVAIGVPALMISVASYFSGGEAPPWWFQIVSTATAALMWGVILGVAARSFHSFARIADQIFAGLQFDDPESVDLPKRLSAASGQLTPEEKMNYHPWKRWVYKY